MKLTNQLLIATPDMQDKRFSKAVILICEHNEHGALGINLNLHSEVSFNDILDSLQMSPTYSQDQHTIYEGGPVNTQCGFILHQSARTFDSSIDVSSSISLTTSKDIIKAIAYEQFEDKWLMALGCATWDGGQLEQEIADNAWLISPCEDKLVFDHDHNKWDMALALMGIEAHQLSSDVGHA